MVKWSDSYRNNKFGPKLKNYGLTEEYLDGKIYIDMEFILLNDISEVYRADFTTWVEENGYKIIVERKITTIDGEVTNTEEKEAVNMYYWDKWYNIYGTKKN